MNTVKLWDIFCKVIDNYGDIGVCWRLSQNLVARGQRVRLWVDDPSALTWMAPQGSAGIEVRTWDSTLALRGQPMGDVFVEAFGCEIAPEFIAAYADSTRARGLKGTWINLEYLTAERYAERSHGLPSPVMHGPGAGLNKHFFYPGFTPATGGLLREPDLPARQARFERTLWLRQLGLPPRQPSERLISLFCYEPPALNQLLAHLANDSQPTRLLITPGRASAAMQNCIEHQNKLNPLWNNGEQLSFSYLPVLSQDDFDHLLWACDLNFVRGEDSLVRAIWANRPFVWHIYAQDDDAHHLKLNAFLDRMKAPPSLRAFHHVWNGLSQAPLPPLAPPEWQTAAGQLRDLQQAQTDLASQLVSFAMKTN